jgi:hypothetical protein
LLLGARVTRRTFEVLFLKRGIGFGAPNTPWVNISGLGDAQNGSTEQERFCLGCERRQTRQVYPT